MVRVCLLAGLVGLVAVGQEVTITPRARVQNVNLNVPRANLRMDVQLVQIPVTVTRPARQAGAGSADGEFPRV